MQSNGVYYVAILALGMLVFSPEGGEGVCCRASWAGKCADCKAPGIGKFYCGKGDCNMFGCNCDNGCFEGSCRRRRSVEDHVGGQDDVDFKTGNDIVRFADNDADGALNASEVKVFLGRSGVVVEIDAFHALDADGDGKLTAREIDADVL